MIRPVNDSCEEYLIKWLDTLEEKDSQPGPAFFFLDQFGYSHVSMKLVSRIMCHKSCEVFTYLNWDRMNNYLDDETKWNAIDLAFGGIEWRNVHSLAAVDRSVYMRETYKRALGTYARVKFTWHVAMCDKNNKLTHWLFFCTNSIRGLEEMKKAMWKVDSTGCFQFSDKDNPEQFHLFDQYSVRLLAADIRVEFKGKETTVRKVHEFVLTETPEYREKPALKSLEMEDHLKPIDPPANRRKGTFPDPELKIQIL